MPEIKTIAVLNNATRGKPTRRSFVWTGVFLIALLVFAMLPLGAEIWRRDRIVESRREFAAATEPVVSRFAHVKDWRAWHQSQLSGTDGSAKWRAWATKWGDIVKPPFQHHAELSHGAHERINRNPRFYHAEPSKADLRAALAETQPAIDELSTLLEFDNLIGMPVLDAGDSDPGFLTATFAAGILYDRVYFLAYLGDYAGLGRELELLAGLRLRMTWPETLNAYLVATGIEMHLITGCELLLPHAQLPAPVAAALESLARRAPDFWERLVENELARIARMFSESTENDWNEFVKNPEGREWFGWIETSKDLDDNFEAFRYGHLELTMDAAYLRRLLLWARLPTPSPANVPEDVTLRSPWSGTFERDQRLAAQNSRVPAAALLRRQEAEGFDLRLGELPVGRFPDIEVNWTGAAMRVQYKPGPQRSLFSNVPDDEFDEHEPPLLLTPAR